MSDEDTLESFWQDLHPVRPRGGVDPRQQRKSTDLDASLKLACEKATHELTQQFADLDGQLLTLEILGHVISTGVKIFMAKWREGLKEQDLACLIEIVLEGQSLPLNELQGFVRALPSPLLERIAKSALGRKATGTHGLMALEHAQRTGLLNDYVLGQDSGKLYAEFTHPRSPGEPGGERIRFYLDDEFEVPQDRLQSPVR